ncbi:hypothetical protein [Denitratimonas sp. CY0512]|uniref:hypothetical protein n=1 Tax=Denitratimonas sp. CY0512 TaxID=3131940 RepID=UPI0030A1DD20
MTNRRIFQGPVAWLALLLAFAAPVAALTEDDGYRPEPNSIVHTLTSTPFGTLVGGNFTAIAGESRGKWAMLDAAGEATPYPKLGFSSGVVLAGLQTTNASGVAETVIAGSFAGHIRRFNVLGEPAIPWSAPNPDGTIRALAEQPVTSGAPGIYIAGEFSTVNGQTRRRVALLNANGSHSTSFLPPNFTGTAHALAVQDDGKLLVAGSIGIAGQIPARRLYRLNEDGSLDNGFQASGLAGGNRTVQALQVEDDGRILVAGEVDGDGFVLRLNADGSLDGDYEPPSLNGPVYALDLLPDGRALIGGDFTSGVGPRSRIARLNEDGSVDNGFALLVTPNAAVRAVLVQDDGAVLLGGAFNQIGGLGRNRLARLDAQGRVDQLLEAGLFNNQPRAIAVQSDGRVLVGGRFFDINGASRRHLARLHPNGAVDSSFAPIISRTVEAVVVQRDGRILIGGGFERVNGVARYRLARLHPDGSLDTSFQASANSDVSAIHVLDDGKILIGGYFTQVNGVARQRLARLHPNGALDTNFNPNWNQTESPGYVVAIAVDDNGWVFSCGIGQSSSRRLARFTPTGQLWTSFDPTFISQYPQCWSIVMAVNNVAAGGDFRYSFGGTQRAWSMIDQDGNHTVTSPFGGGRIFSVQKRGNGYLTVGKLIIDGEDQAVALLNAAGNGLQTGVQPYTSGEVTYEPLGLQMTADGRILVGRSLNAGEYFLVRLANPDGLPLRQRIVWGTPGNPERLVWDRMTGFGSAPALLGTPRVLVSQTCCDEDDFVPAAGGGWMSRDGDDWRLEGFAGLPGKFYVRIEYRAGNSKGSSTFLTPIQRLYGEVPPGVDTADLSLKLVIDQDPVEPGDVVIVDVLAGNAGPDLAGLPSVTLDLPAGYTLIDFDDSDQGTFLPGDMLWKLDDLAGSGPGAGAQLRLQLQVTQQTPHTIEAQIFAAEFDPNLNDNVATLTPDVQRSRSDLNLVHTVDPQFALPGHEAIFTVLVENLGPDPASGVEVNYLRPTGYSYANHSASQGSYNSASGLWQVGTLAAGQSATLLVRTQVNGSGGFTSSAQASSHSEDPDPFNNLAFAVVDPFTDLALDIQADTDAATLNEQVMLSITVDNNGPREADATSVLLEPLAGGLMPVDHFVTHGDYEPVTGVWSIGPLAPGERAEMQFEGQVIVLQDTVMAATVGSDAYELVPGDESGSVTILYGQPGGGAIFADGFEEGGTE